MEAMPPHAEELRQLDAVLGDGDLGLTVSGGSAAVRDIVNSAEDSATADSIFLEVAKAFMNANPSTFAALIGGGLLASAHVVKGKDDLSRSDTVAIAKACVSSISRQGRSQLGDKTVLDALVPSIAALEDADGDTLEALDAMITSTRTAIEAIAARQSTKGRAAWLRERSVGHKDPGSMAYLFLLMELRRNWVE